jgi:hypothetical protein
LVKELVEMIGIYRKNVLFIPTTNFHRGACSAVQYLMDSRTLSSMESAPKVRHIKMADNYLVSSLDNSWWSSNLPEDSLIEMVTDLIPDRQYFVPRIFEFMDISSNGIFEQLGTESLI